MTVAAILLSDQKLLNSYLKGKWLEPRDLKQYLFHALREQQPLLPDYATESAISYAGIDINEKDSATSYAKLLLAALNNLAEPLELRGSSLYVKQAHFELWHQRLTLTMPLSIISFFGAQKLKEEAKAKQYFSQWFSNQSCLPRPYLPELNQVFSQGVSEHHLHIMGTTENDFIWLEALKAPKAMVKYFQKALTKEASIQQLQQINPNLTYAEIYRLIRVAANLRQQMLNIVINKANSLTTKFFINSIRDWPTEFSSQHPAASYTKINCFHVNEAMLLYTFYRYLNSSHNELAARILHVYLLIQGLFNKVLSQQLNDKGFQQFAKITENELREKAEQRFEQRFKQLQGMYKNPLSLLEARFAPKENTNKLRRVLKPLVKGYNVSCKSGKPDLSLTAHFIKKPDKPSGIISCRHYSLRKSLHKQKQVLLNFLDKNPVMKSLVVAVDAAGNEMDAGADVFAPLYRQLRLDGIKYFTYHAGEDFKHLLSGMRQIYEAIEFLDLQAGDRIGHATAIGINPNLWLSRTVKEQKLEKGEWLDNLLFAHHLLLLIGTPEANSVAYKQEDEILRLAEFIFQVSPLSLPALKDAWLERWRDPIEKSTEQPKNLAELLRLAWHKPEVYLRARDKKWVKTDHFNTEVYWLLQEKMLELVCQKQLALETLPTSNLRISYYKTYAEHHVHRWLNPDVINRPLVVIGSDDPGIFSTNLTNEYAHIYLSSKNDNSNNALSMVQEIAENGRNFGFYSDKIPL